MSIPVRIAPAAGAEQALFGDITKPLTCKHRIDYQDSHEVGRLFVISCKVSETKGGQDRDQRYIKRHFLPLLLRSIDPPGVCQ